MLLACLPSDPPWLVTAWSQLGVRETPGEADTRQVRIYHGATRAGMAPDAIPWCSSFVNWCLMQNGIVGTRSRAARSWLRWSGGEQLDEVVRGAIVVFARGEGGHVGFALGVREDREIVVLGGNQRDQVSLAPHGPERLGVLWPRGFPRPGEVAA